jgi:hypothetical protein
MAAVGFQEQESGPRIFRYKPAPSIGLNQNQCSGQTMPEEHLQDLETLFQFPSTHLLGNTDATVRNRLMSEMLDVSPVFGEILLL